MKAYSSPQSKLIARIIVCQFTNMGGVCGERLSFTSLDAGSLIRLSNSLMSLSNSLLGGEIKSLFRSVGNSFLSCCNNWSMSGQ